ncbi:MAG TPA: PAS domain-containing protein [Bacteroidia bacterium]|nr:PAS domain-containing protein [Bacteroidia bacterium]
MKIVLERKILDWMSLENFNADAVESVAKSVGFWGVIFGGLITFFKKVIQPIWRFFKEYNEHKELLLKGNENIENILKELRPNGGSSLKDQLSRIENSVDLLDVKVAAVAIASNVGYWKSDSKGNAIEVGKSLCAILGRTESEIKGSNWVSSIHTSDRIAVKNEWDSSVRDNRNFEMNYRFVKPDGSIQKVKVSAFAIIKDNTLQGFFGTLVKDGEPYFEN